MVITKSEQYYGKENLMLHAHWKVVEHVHVSLPKQREKRNLRFDHGSNQKSMVGPMVFSSSRKKKKVKTIEKQPNNLQKPTKTPFISQKNHWKLRKNDFEAQMSCFFR